jgi:hypothetical protein
MKELSGRKKPGAAGKRESHDDSPVGFVSQTGVISTDASQAVLPKGKANSIAYWK